MITPLSLDDLPRLMEIEWQSYLTPWSEAMFRQEFSNALGVSYGWREETLLGFLFAWRIFEDLHVNNVAVAPEARERGVASRLVEALLDDGRRCGAKRVLLEVRPSNTNALGLYAKFGFTLVASRPGYYEDTGEDALVMVKELEGSTQGGRP